MKTRDGEPRCGALHHRYALGRHRALDPLRRRGARAVRRGFHPRRGGADVRRRGNPEMRTLITFDGEASGSAANARGIAPGASAGCGRGRGRGFRRVARRRRPLQARARACGLPSCPSCCLFDWRLGVVAVLAVARRDLHVAEEAADRLADRFALELLLQGIADLIDCLAGLLGMANMPLISGLMVGRSSGPSMRTGTERPASALAPPLPSGPAAISA